MCYGFIMDKTVSLERGAAYFRVPLSVKLIIMFASVQGMDIACGIILGLPS